jgi:two-component system phosphate regulon sensor histidine kinase PhoR
MVILISLNSDLLLLVLLFMVMATAVVSLLWFLRERRLLRSLQALIAEEKMENLESKHSNPKDMKEALRALFETRKEELLQLQRLENYRRDYIGNVAHELKTPIFSIQGYIDTVLDDPDMDLETREKFLQRANKNASRLGQIVSDLDTITKYESGFLVLNIQPFDMLALVNEVAESLELQAQEKQISIQVYAQGEGNIVLGDRDRLAQVLTNLGFNSIRYGVEGGNTRFRLTNIGERMMIEVADNGIGIPTEHQNRVFERFFRVDKHRNRATGGSGLGLSICKHIVEAHGETIDLISTEGAGSVFTFSLKTAD